MSEKANGAAGDGAAANVGDVGTDTITETKNAAQVSWRDVLPVHPAAEMFPHLDAVALADLTADIETRGLTSPIVIWTPSHDVHDVHLLRRGKRKGIEFCLLDGRNRLDAIAKLNELELADDGWPLIGNIPAVGHDDRIVVVGPEVDPFAFVVSANVHRRHLTAEQKRDFIDLVREDG